MTDINPALIPTIPPGTIFDRFTTDETLNVRWLSPTEPVFFEVFNRPLADITVRQLIIAKALDAIELNLGHITLFPFLVPPKLKVGSGEIDLPRSWIWDMHTSIPTKWEYLRLAKIKRISGTNHGGTGSEITGKLRLIFTAQQHGYGTEVALFSADYQIDSALSFQYLRIVPCTSAEEPVPIDPAEQNTISGWLIFRTLDLQDEANRQFFMYVAPPVDATDSDNDGNFDVPAVYEIAASVGDASNNDFLMAALEHGTGVTVASAFNAIPALDSDFASWLKSTNYPFRIGATRTSMEGITVPQALFNEFCLVAPTADEPTSDTSLKNSPVWLSSIDRLDTLATQLKFNFSTNSINDDGTVNQVVEFASLVLHRNYYSGQVVAITPTSNLLKASGTDSDNFLQGFGSGHVVLGSLWGTTSGEVIAFFDQFLSLTTTTKVTFTKDAGKLGSFALARNSRFVPTKGQWHALLGSTSRRTNVLPPSDNNRFITEADQGEGDRIDLSQVVGLTENPDIENIAYAGSLAHKAVKLIVDSAGTQHNYDNDILPRLRILLGRDPIFMDVWWDGTLFKLYTGDEWISI